MPGRDDRRRCNRSHDAHALRSHQHGAEERSQYQDARAQQQERARMTGFEAEVQQRPREHEDGAHEGEREARSTLGAQALLRISAHLGTL